MPSQLDVEKIRHTNGTDALTFDSSGNTNLQKDLKFGSTAAIKNSAGNNILSESGGNVTIQNVRLPASGGISDSSGNALLTESGGAVSLGSTVVPSSSMMFRNKIINGNFDIWQRGTSQTSSGYGSADRWHITNSGSTKTASQQLFTNGQTEVPGNPKYYLRHVVTSVSGASNYVIAQQKIEGVATLAGKTATLSFWAKADANKNIATEITQRFGTGGSPSANVDAVGVTTYNLTTSWQKFTATVSIPSISGKTIGTNGNDRLELLFWFDSGSDYNSRTNSLGQQSGTFDIAQVQVEEGPVATPFEQRPIGTELSLCQRYFQSAQMSGIFIHPYHTTHALVNFPLFVPLRKASSVTVSKTARVIRITTGGVADYWIDGTGASQFSGSGDWGANMYIDSPSNRDGTLSHLGLRFNKSGGANFPDQEPIQISGVVNSTNDSLDPNGGYIDIECEL